MAKIYTNKVSPGRQKMQKTQYMLGQIKKVPDGLTNTVHGTQDKGHHGFIESDQQKIALIVSSHFLVRKIKK